MGNERVFCDICCKYGTLEIFSMIDERSSNPNF